MNSLQAPPSPWLQKIAIDFSCLFHETSTTMLAGEGGGGERTRERERSVGDKKRAKGRCRRRGQGWKHAWKGETTEEERETGTDTEWKKNEWREREKERRAREREQGGGCGFPSWLLLIFCKPQSASAISIHFLHLSLPFSSLPPPLHSAQTPSLHILLLLTLSITSSPSLPATDLFPYLPACLPPIYSWSFIVRHPHFLFLPYRTISIHDLHQPLSYRLSLFNYIFPFHVQMEKHRREWVNRNDRWKDRW